MRVCTTCFAPSGPREVWDAALFHCGDRFLLARPMPSSSPMACIAHVRGLGSFSCFARPYHLLGALGARRCGSAPWSLRASSTRPRATAAAAPELRGACGRAACAPRRSARRRLPSVTAEPRVPPRIRRCPSGRGPVKRGGRDERLDGQGRVAGGIRRQRGGAQPADRAWRERQLAQSFGAPPHVPRVGARAVAASAASLPPPRHGPTRRRLPTPASLRGAPRRWLRRRPAHTRSLAHASSTYGARRTPPCSHVVSSHIVGFDSPQVGDCTALMWAAANGREGCLGHWRDAARLGE